SIVWVSFSLPLLSPANTERFWLRAFATIRSELPSPSKSPATSDSGASPTSITGVREKSSVSTFLCFFPIVGLTINRITSRLANPTSHCFRLLTKLVCLLLHPGYPLFCIQYPVPLL